MHRVASEPAATGWKLKAIISDNGSEFRSREFAAELRRLGIQHRPIRAGRPTSNGNVERLQLTILQECWRPAFVRALAPKSTALKQDLEQYLQTYNYDRAHTGRLTRRRVPADIDLRSTKGGSPTMSNRR